VDLRGERGPSGVNTCKCGIKAKKHKKISKLCVCEEWEKRENVNGKREDERIRG